MAFVLYLYSLNIAVKSSFIFKTHLSFSYKMHPMKPEDWLTEIRHYLKWASNQSRLCSYKETSGVLADVQIRDDQIYSLNT